MKKISIELLVCALFSLQSYAEDNNGEKKDQGFKHMVDFTVGVRTNVDDDVHYSNTVGWTGGYQFPFGLFVGAGPVLSLASIGDEESHISAGALVKARYTAVQLHSKVVPFAEWSGGGMYNWATYDGGDVSGAGPYIEFAIGAKFKNRYCLGFQATVTSYDGPDWGYWDISEKITSWTYGLYFSFDL